MHPKKPDYPLFALLAFSAGIFCIQLDAFALNLALPQIGHDLRATAGWLKWTVSAYLLTVGTLMLATGRLSDHFGHRQLLIIGLRVFGTASLCCALAPSIPVLVLSRMLQGAGGACIMPAGLALMSHMYPPEIKSRAIGLAIGIGGIGMLCGPFVGDALAEMYSWRFIFWLNVPIAGVATLLAIQVKGHQENKRDLPLDKVGLVILTISLALLSILIDQVLTQAVLSTTNIALSFLLLALLIYFALYERKLATPLIEMSLFQNRNYVALLGAGAMANAFTVVYLFVIPLSLGTVWNLSSKAAGMAFFLPALSMALGGPIAGRVSTENAVLTMSRCLGIVALALFVSSASENFWCYLALVTLSGIFLGIANALTLVATQAVVDSNIAGTAIGVTKTAITIAAGLGVILSGQSADQAAGLSDQIAIPTAIANLSFSCCLTAAVLYIWVFAKKIRTFRSSNR